MISDGSCFLRDEHAVNREINEASAVEARAVGMTVNCRRQKMRSFEKRDVFAVDLAVDDGSAIQCGGKADAEQMQKTRYTESDKDSVGCCKGKREEKFGFFHFG